MRQWQTPCSYVLGCVGMQGVLLPLNYGWYTRIYTLLNEAAHNMFEAVHNMSLHSLYSGGQASTVQAWPSKRRWSVCWIKVLVTIRAA